LRDKTYKCIELPPDRDLNKELKKGFSNETIQRLAGERPIFGATTDEQLDAECTICMMEIEPGELYKTNCMHKFCMDCAQHLMNE